MKCINYTKWNVYIKDDVWSSNFIYFCITVKKKPKHGSYWSSVRPSTLNYNKENGSNLTAEEEIILIEDILKCEGTLFGKM